MQTYTIIISEEQLVLIQKIIDHLPNDVYLEKNEVEEIHIISGMIRDTIEVENDKDEGDEDIIHGWCY
jgi:hypothetical protein